MQTRRTNRYRKLYTTRHSESPLRLAVRLTLNQISNGIAPAEAIQFAARYHDVMCSAIQTELADSHLLSRDAFFLPKLV